MGSDSIDYLFCERTDRPPRALELVYLWYERENFPGDMQRIGLECQTQKIPISTRKAKIRLNTQTCGALAVGSQLHKEGLCRKNPASERRGEHQQVLVASDEAIRLAG